MSSQEDDKIIEQELEQHIEKEAYLQTLEKPKTILTRIESPSALIAMYVDIQQKTVRSQERNKTLESVISAKKIGYITKNCKLEQKMKNQSI